LFTKDAKPKLPPATMEGKNSFGCLVNGKVFINERTNLFGGNGVHSEMPNKNWLLVYASNENTGITLSLYDTTGIEVNKTYMLSNDTTYFGKFDTRVGNISCEYNYSHILSGKMLLTKIDVQKNIISGTFEFVSYNPNCIDTVKITEGRFDIGELIR
jgi:hypothetical protein